MKLSVLLKKSALLLVLCSVFCNSDTNAQQWHLYKGLPVNIIPKDITANNNGTLYLLTTTSEIFYKTPISDIWMPVVGPFGTNSSLLNAQCIAVDKNADRLYVGSYYLGLYYTSDLGSSWGNTFLETNGTSGFHEGYKCITDIQNSSLFYAGIVGEAAVTKFTNQGLNGTITTFDNNPNSGVESILETANHTVLVGTFNTGIWYSGDNGTSYTQSAVNNRQIISFAEDTSGKVYALSKDLNTNIFSLLYSSDYQNWDTLSLPDYNIDYTTIFYDSSSNMLWLGSQEGIYKTSVNNIGWQSSDFNNTHTQVIKFIVAANHLYVFSNQYTAQQLNTSTGTWDMINDGFTGQVNDMVFNASHKLFAFHNFYSNIVAALATPAGEWIKTGIGTFYSGIRQMVIDNQQNIFCNAAASTAIFKSADEGASFQEIPLPDTFSQLNFGGIISLKSGQAEGIYICHSGLQNVLYTSSDMGNSWNTAANFPMGISITDFAQDADGNMFILVSDLGLVELYYSQDNGNNWSIIAQDTFPDFEMESLYSKDHQTFIVNSDKVYKISMSDTSFNEISFPFTFNPSVGSITDFLVNSDGHMYVNYDGVYMSNDNGVNWQSLGWPDALQAGTFPGKLALLADTIPCLIIGNASPGNERGIYYFGEEMTPPTAVQDINNAVVDIIIFPNPAGNTVWIGTAVPKGTIRIIDIKGRTIKTFPVKSTLNTIPVNDLGKGIYFVKVNGRTGRFVKL